MPGLSYDRYGLTGNPFRDLISENLVDVEAFHVNLEVDRSLQVIKEEVLAKENRVVVALVGAIGSGKTERLRVASAEAVRQEAMAFLVNVSPSAGATWKDIGAEIEKVGTKRGFAKLFSSPAWFRGLSVLRTSDKKPIDARKAAKIVADALNGKPPCFLLLNDLHNLAPAAEITTFATFLQELTDQVKPGVLVMFGSYANFYLALSKAQPSFASRVSRTFTLPTLTDEEASLMLAKKLLAKRLVENLDPLFPFDNEAVQRLNQAAFGNPRRLLELADFALERGVATRSYRIDSDVVQAALESRIRSDPGGTPSPTGSPAPARAPVGSPSAAAPGPAAPPAAKAAPRPAPASAATTAPAARPNYLED